jgi:hypothetical protein
MTAKVDCPDEGETCSSCKTAAKKGAQIVRQAEFFFATDYVGATT